METNQDPVLKLLKDKINPVLDHSKRILISPEDLALKDDPK